MKKVILYGNKSTAKEMYYCLKFYSNYDVVGFCIDKEYLESEKFCDLPVVTYDNVEKVFSPKKFNMLIAIGYVGNNKIRKEKYFQTKEKGYQLISYISPKAVTYPELLVGDNCIVHHCTVISSGVKIGNNVMIGPGCTISHDVVIGDHCFISNGVSIAGSVTIGECCYLGTNSIIRNKIEIGNECVIGAGAVLLQDAEDRSVFMGEPACLLSLQSNELPLG